MKRITNYKLIVAALAMTSMMGACSSNNDVALPNINGYANSDAVASANLIAYWPLDGNGTDTKRNLTATSSSNVTYTTGVKGQSAQFANGYIYSASPLTNLANGQAWTLSAWVQATNNFVAGGNPPANNHPYSIFQATRPGQLFGSINETYEAGAYAAVSDTMFFKSLYQDASGGLQDAVNNYGVAGTDYKVVKKAGTGQWVHVVTTYNPAGGTGAQSIFRIYADSAQVNNTLFENRGTNSFKYTPGEVIIGGWYNNIPGKTVSADLWTTGFTGKIDEVRLYNKLLTTDEITALYHLGKAGR
ncbi:MAG: LamG-like jellyroll fold domain-containing protein [Ferruginibacter sp.]